MTDDRGMDTERRLREWLEAEARPMPADLRRSVVDVSARHAQLGPRSPWDLSRRGWQLAVSATAAVLVGVAVLSALGLIGSLRDFAGGPGTSDDVSASRLASASPPAEFVWDATANFVGLNPAGDAYGHDVVWSYLYGHAGASDPTQYIPLPAYTDEPAPRWYEPAIEGLYIGTAPNEPLLQMEPIIAETAIWSPILAWRNPIEATSLTIEGSVEVDGSCGHGITFTIHDAGGTFQSIELPRGRESFSIPAERFDRGGIVYFKVDPLQDSPCATTWLSLVITAP